MSNYFLDSSVLIAYLKEEDTYTVEIVDNALKSGATVTIAAITVAEITSASDMNNLVLREKRMALLSLLDVKIIDRAIATRGGELRRIYNLALPDALIAACAEQAGGEFLSKDPHFNRLINANVLNGRVY
jgi:predicted nucleic acid-binding protein